MYTQYTISLYKNENHPKLCQICNYGICSKGLKNESEIAVVNKPSVFEPLKFYCIAGKLSMQIFLRHMFQNAFCADWSSTYVANTI